MAQETVTAEEAAAQAFPYTEFGQPAVINAFREAFLMGAAFATQQMEKKA